MQDGLEKMDGANVCAQLARGIAAIEDQRPLLDNGVRGDRQDKGLGRVSMGIAAIDRVLDPYHGRGIEYAALHEIRSATTLSFGAAAGFALALGNHMKCERHRHAAHLLSQGTANDMALGSIFWIADRFCRSEAGEFYGPGLYPMGVDPSRLVRISPRDFDEAVWAAGEIASTGNQAFGILEVRGNPRQLDMATTRRLKLRCQNFQTLFFILRQAGVEENSAAATRWLVEPALSYARQHSRFIGKAAWNVSLEKCHGGKTGNWTLEWNHHEQIFQIADRLHTYPSPHPQERKKHCAMQLTQTPAPLSGNLIATTGN